VGVTEIVTIVLVGWAGVALGYIFGWITRDRLTRAAGRTGTPDPVSTEPEPTPARVPAESAVPRTQEIRAQGPGARWGGMPVELPERYPRRRVDDAPDAELRPPLPGGRRRSDGPRMTRSEARRLRGE
jgi:hypothetical protein